MVYDEQTERHGRLRVAITLSVITYSAERSESRLCFAQRNACLVVLDSVTKTTLPFHHA